jgi:hypothetical protein
MTITSQKRKLFLLTLAAAGLISALAGAADRVVLGEYFTNEY